jgi:hypothetical protein
VLESDWYAAGGYQGQDVVQLAKRRAVGSRPPRTRQHGHLDTLGRPFLAIAHNSDEFATRSVLDVQAAWSR